MLVPNPPDPSAPAGAEEEDAVELRRVGEQPSFEFEPRDHLELGWIDMERAARVSGSRFAYRMGDFALAEIALYRFALDRVVQRGFVPVIPPVLVREEAMYGTGFLPTDEVNIYSIERDGLYLTGTSEVALASLHLGEILEEEALPLHYAGYSTCFRREAGAAGKDTRGMFRVHQFDKVEMFVFCLPERSAEEHELLLTIEEELVAALEIPLPGRQRRRRRPRGVRDEEVRHRGLVSVTGPLPGDHVDLEHDRFPGSSARRALPLGAGRSARSHPERNRRHRTRPARGDGEPPAGGRLGCRSREPATPRRSCPDRARARTKAPLGRFRPRAGRPERADVELAHRLLVRDRVLLREVRVARGV